MSNVNLRHARVRASGRFFRLANDKWYAKGFCYGPFAANSGGEPLPARAQVSADFEHMSWLGATCIRTYYPPPAWLLETALDYGLRVLVDVPWEKHRCFFEDWTSQQQAREIVRETARRCGGSAAVFAISVANEIPNDVVRFYGHRRVERFLDELLDIVHQESPECLATYANFPTTEFLQPLRQDFCCFNVYLHDQAALGSYLDRLQHIAGATPLVIGEFGIDSIRGGEDEQAANVVDFVRTVYRHGAAGSFVFSYTDDWFTGGHQIEDWAFGVTRRDRSEKPVARRLAAEWSNLPHVALGCDLPKASVIVCSYNGAATLQECLQSLMGLEYPDYEVILVDDGSEDATPQLAAQFPQVRYIRQENKGLSVARNVGLEVAEGEVVAYIDSDCVVDEDWLTYLIHGMHAEQVDAIGGPNLTPAGDGLVAKCVAASPGNPAHVMFDDQHAEHVPGCNMAFRRRTLLDLGGFDPQFRQAGDDVDVCWRMLDADLPIGFAPGAMVWHHRRATIRAYLKQQRGYGRSEALLHFKHPERCGVFRRSIWRGVIYEDAAVSEPFASTVIYHGRLGLAPFQTIYRNPQSGYSTIALSIEWHLAAAYSLLLATLFAPLAAIAAGLWGCTLLVAVASARSKRLPDDAPWWSRPLVTGLHVLQPMVRGWYRLTHLLRSKRLPQISLRESQASRAAGRFASTHCDLWWESDERRGREELLWAMTRQGRAAGWPGDYGNPWAEWDMKLVGDRWHDIEFRTATEELGGQRRFTRARAVVTATGFSHVMTLAAAVWSATSLMTGHAWGIGFGVAACSAVLVSRVISRRRCLNSAWLLLEAALRSIDLREAAPESETAEDVPFEGRLPEMADATRHPAQPATGCPGVLVPVSVEGSLQ